METTIAHIEECYLWSYIIIWCSFMSLSILTDLIYLLFLQKHASLISKHSLWWCLGQTTLVRIINCSCLLYLKFSHELKSKKSLNCVLKILIVDLTVKVYCVWTFVKKGKLKWNQSDQPMIFFTIYSQNCLELMLF